MIVNTFVKTYTTFLAFFRKGTAFRWGKQNSLKGL